MSPTDPGVAAPGSISIPAMLRALLEIAIRDSSLSHVDGKGNLRLELEICFGDNGEYLWDTSTLAFSPKRTRAKNPEVARELIPRG